MENYTSQAFSTIHDAPSESSSTHSTGYNEQRFQPFPFDHTVDSSEICGSLVANHDQQNGRFQRPRHGTDPDDFGDRDSEHDLSKSDGQLTEDDQHSNYHTPRNHEYDNQGYDVYDNEQRSNGENMADYHLHRCQIQRQEQNGSPYQALGTNSTNHEQYQACNTGVNTSTPRSQRREYTADACSGDESIARHDNGVPFNPAGLSIPRDVNEGITCPGNQATVRLITEGRDEQVSKHQYPAEHLLLGQNMASRHRHRRRSTDSGRSLTITTYTIDTDGTEHVIHTEQDFKNHVPDVSDRRTNRELADISQSYNVHGATNEINLDISRDTEHSQRYTGDDEGVKKKRRRKKKRKLRKLKSGDSGVETDHEVNLRLDTDHSVEKKERRKHRHSKQRDNETKTLEIDNETIERALPPSGDKDRNEIRRSRSNSSHRSKRKHSKQLRRCASQNNEQMEGTLYEINIERADETEMKRQQFENHRSFERTVDSNAQRHHSTSKKSSKSLVTEGSYEGNDVRPASYDIFSVGVLQSQRPTSSGAADDTTNNDHDHQKELICEQRDRRAKNKKLNLKKTSAKVSVTTSYPPLPLLLSRLDLKKTARTGRSGMSDLFGEKEIEPEEEDHREPLLFCKLITRFPMTCFLFLTAIHIAVFATTLTLLLKGNDVFPAVFDDLPLYIYNEPRLKELSWRRRTFYNGYVYRPVYGYTFNTGYRGRVKDSFEVIFEKPGENVLTQRHLNLIKETEERLFQMKRYQDHFCLLDSSYRCIKPQSIIRFFDGTYSDVDPIFTDPNFDNITEVLYKAAFYNETKEYLQLFLGKDSHIKPTRSFTSITRTVLFVGWPLYVIDQHYGTTEDIQEFLANTFKPEVERIRDFDLVEILDVYYISKLLYEYDLVKQALVDIKLAIGSFLFIFVFMCFQTGSVIVTLLGIMSILSSFLLTNLFYRYALQFKYFGFFHVIAIFLILGIGADDLFVFYDTWRLSGHNKYPSDAHRLSDCYRKAAKTTFVTSITTMMAFLVSGFSSLLPVRTFGIFSGLLIFLNYIWVILYFPTIIMLHHTKTKFVWKWFRDIVLSICCDRPRRTKLCRRQSVDSASSSESQSVTETGSAAKLLRSSGLKTHPNTTDDIGHTESNSSPRYQTHPELPTVSKLVSLDSIAMNGEPNQTDLTVDADDTHLKVNDMTFHNHLPSLTLDLKMIENEAEKQEFLDKKQEYLDMKRNKPRKFFEDRNVVVKFLKNGFFDLMTKRAVKFAVPLVFLGAAIFFIHRATLIEPDTQQVRLFRANHNYAKATERHYYSFIRNHEDEYQRLYLVWGMGPADISMCNQKSADYCFGEPTWDEGFTMNTEETQRAFMDVCNRLENMDAQMAKKLHIRRDSTGKLKIHCFTKDFDKYFQEEVASNNYPAATDLTLPVNSGNASLLMDRHPYIYRKSLPTDFDNYFGIMMSYWLTNAYSLYSTQGYMDHNELYGEQFEAGTSQYAFYDYSNLYYGTKMKYLAIEVNTTMNVFNMGYDEGLPVYYEWEKLIDDINKIMPTPLKNGIQLTEMLWHWLFVQKTLADSAIIGILVGLLSAWPILVLTTLNFIIGTIAAVTIGLVSACVVGIIPLAGWKLGVLESINLCMVVGLSVDYIVHLAEAYRSSKSVRRQDRVHDMLESIGLSVVSGAITTMGAAVFMLFAQIQFFYQFGIFIISTVGISLVFSLLGFTTFLSLCGPEDNTGDIIAFCRGVRRFCSKRSNSVDDDSNNSKRRCCVFPCVGPSVLMERCYDWLSYGDYD